MNILFLRKIKESVKRLFSKYLERDKIKKFPLFYINGSQTLPPPLDSLE